MRIIPLTKFRGRYADATRDCQPKCITAPFGFDVKGLEDVKLKIIVQQSSQIKVNNPNWEYRFCRSIHAKLIIGEKGTIVGSWNMTENSTNNMHETSVYLEGYHNEEFQDFFDEIWKNNK